MFVENIWLSPISLKVVPEASRLWDPFQFQIRHSVSDGYAANTRAEHGLQELMPNFVNNRVFCSAHRLATALGNALNLAANDISGVLNTGLACSQVGSARKLRHCLASIFEERLEVEFSTPPIGAMRHRRATGSKCSTGSFQSTKPLAQPFDDRTNLEDWSLRLSSMGILSL